MFSLSIYRDPSEKLASKVRRNRLNHRRFNGAWSAVSENLIRLFTRQSYGHTSDSGLIYPISKYPDACLFCFPVYVMEEHFRPASHLTDSVNETKEF